VLSFSRVVGIGTPQTPNPQASVPPPPPLGSGGRTCTFAGEIGGVTYTVVLYIRMYVLCVERDIGT
jgi:hypothetical protein